MTIASIDIGTNTVLLLIAEVNEELQLRALLDEYRIPRIGKDLLPEGYISEDKIKELIIVLKEYKKIIKQYKCERIIITATNAIRIAANKDQIIKKIDDQFGWNVNVVSGNEEARLSYLGAAYELSNNSAVMVIDIGGGSTEVIFGKQNEIKFVKSFRAGVVSGTEKYLKSDPPTLRQMENFREHLQVVFNELNSLNFIPDFTISLAGTPTTLACMDLSLDKYDEALIEGYELYYDRVSVIKNNIQRITSAEIKKSYKAVVKGREDLILAGSIILLEIMKLAKLDRVKVSTKGIRYGAIIKEITNNL